MIYSNKFFLLALIFLIHLLFIFFPTVNFEFVFSDAANNFKLNKFNAIDNYFKIQANTFVFPYLLFITNHFLTIDYLLLSRIISILCIIPLGLSIIKFSEIFSHKYSNFMTFIILLNPFIFVMAHRGTPDFISASLSLCTIPYLISKKKFLTLIFFSLILGLAIAIKPTVGIILILINLYLFIHSKFKILSILKNIILINTLSLLPLFLYIFYINLNFNFFITNDYFLSSLKINTIRNFFSNLVLYLGYTYLFIIPLRLTFIMNNIKNFKLNYPYFLISPIILIFAYYFPIPQLELNLSFLSNIIGRKIENFLFTISFFIMIFDIFHNRKVLLKDIIKLTILISLIIFFIIMSFFSPSQRYLICIMPLVIYLFFNFNKFNYLSTIVIYFIFSLFLSINQYLNGKISELVLEDLIEKQIINLSCPGVIEAHSGNKFFIDNKNCNSDFSYTVIYGVNENSISSINVSFLFISKSLSIVKL